jgi:PhzF family phenazine biosynthesis protein
MPLPLLQIDSFTDTPFAGNPAAVCLLPYPAEPDWMQQVAAEMNLSETAFISPPDTQTGAYPLQWFTPTTEVDLCGHATLASAHAMWEAGLEPPDHPILFSTRSGQLVAQRQEDWITLDFPAAPVSPLPCPAGLAEALGQPVSETACSASGYLLVQVADLAKLLALQPDFTRLAQLDYPLVIVTCRVTEKMTDRLEQPIPLCDFASRVFAPRLGIDEDPVTGSAHCALAPYWAERIGRLALTGYQASARGGVVRTLYQPEPGRVELAGQAVTVIRGTLLSTPTPTRVAVAL